MLSTTAAALILGGIAPFSRGAARAATPAPAASPAPGTTPSNTMPGTTPSNTILVVGDSLSAEYGLKRGSGWVGLLEQRLARDRIGFGADGSVATVVNASISGETTAGGWSRLPALLERHHPAVVIIALGSNDALRGLDLASTGRNLTQMVDASRAAGAKPILVGMMLPPNYGKAYADRFAALYASIAKDHDAVLVPFLMAGFAEDMTKFQADRIHPNESAQAAMLDNVWPAIETVARRR